MRYAHPISGYEVYTGAGDQLASALMGPLWMLWKGIYGPAAVWSFAAVAIFAIFRVWPIDLLVYGIVHVVFALSAPTIIAQDLLRHGWSVRK